MKLEHGTPMDIEGESMRIIREELEENPVIEKDLTAIRQETREIDRTLKQELQEEQRELKQSVKK